MNAFILGSIAGTILSYIGFWVVGRKIPSASTTIGVVIGGLLALVVGFFIQS